MATRPFGSRYFLGEVIGRGAMGRVYRAQLRSGGPDVAVKLLRDDLTTQPEVVGRFVQERELLRGISHPNVVRVHDLVVEGDELGIVMDLIPAGHLRRALPPPVAPQTAVQLLAQVADGLAAVHAAGVVHRDLKPENILVETLPSGERCLRLTDFGISRLIGNSSTHLTSVIGTPGYLAPEVAQGMNASRASDVYALGVMLYEWCTGRPPFQAESPHALMRMHAEDPVPRPEGMPQELSDLFSAMLAKDAASRPDAQQVAHRLRAMAPQLAGLPPFEIGQGALPLISRTQAAPQAADEAVTRLRMAGLSSAPPDHDSPTLSRVRPTPLSMSSNMGSEPISPLTPSRERRSAPRPLLLGLTAAALAVALTAGFVALRNNNAGTAAVGMTTTPSGAASPSTSSPATVQGNRLSSSTVSAPPAVAVLASSTPPGSPSELAPSPTRPPALTRGGPTAQGSIPSSSTAQTHAPTPAPTRSTIQAPPPTSPPSPAHQPVANTVSISATLGWQDSGAVITEGILLKISATGTWSPFTGYTVGPEGCLDTAICSQDPNQTANICCMAHAGLIGRINDGAPFAVGRGTQFTPTVTGQLYLRINDNAQGDDSGRLTVTIRS